MCGLLANYSKDISEAVTYREKGDVQLKHAKLILDKVKNCSIPAVEERSEQLVCPNCDGEGFSGKGTNEILPCLSCFGSGERTD